jgi:hypothetical protein
VVNDRFLQIFLIESFVLFANQLRLSVLANQLIKCKANGDDACTRSLRANCSDRLSRSQIAVPSARRPAAFLRAQIAVLSALAAQLPSSELAS